MVYQTKMEIAEFRYTTWWFTPGDETLNKQGEFDQEPVSANSWSVIPVEQFVYIVKKGDEYKRYVITRGFGEATVIPLSERPKIQNKLGWLTTVLMGGLDGPYAPGEDDDEFDV